MTSKQRSYLKGLAMTMDVPSQRFWLNAPVLRWFRSSARRLFFTSRQRTRQSARSFCLNITEKGLRKTKVPEYILRRE